MELEIEVGSFIGMAAMTQSELRIRDVSYADLGIIPAQFARMGIRFEQQGDDIYIPQQDHYGIESFIDGSIMTIADAPWPGLTPDLLSIFLVVATHILACVLSRPGAAYSGSRRTDTSGFAEPPLPGRTARYFRCLPPVFLVSGIADPGGYALSAEF